MWNDLVAKLLVIKKEMERVLFERGSRRIRRSGRIVVRSPNPVHAVLYRVIVFVNASRRRFLLQVEFRARILRVVYVGAIAVLFRFVVMMLNLSETTSEVGSDQRNRPGMSEGKRRSLGRLRGRGYRGYITRNRRRDYSSASEKSRHEDRSMEKYIEWVKRRDEMWGMHGFGQVLYTDGILYVVSAGIVLLVAMIGSIVLTLKVRTFARAKRQRVDQQRSRDADEAVRRVMAPKNKGI